MKRAILIALACVGIITAVTALVAPSVLADAKSEICAGVGAASGTGGCTDPGGKTIDNVIATVVNILSWLVGIIAVIMIIVGGFRYVTSGGDSSSTGTAKSTIIYAIIGLVIVAFAQFIVQFVLTKV